MHKLAQRLLLYLLFPMIGIGVIYGGCGKQDKVEPPDEAAAESRLFRDATLRLGLAGGPPQPLNPLLTDRSVSMELIKLVYNGLLKINGDMSYEPDLAQSWSISDDGLTYTFNLRKGVRFHDGAELTSADCAFTYALFKSYPAKTPRQSYFESITGYQTPDKYTFKIIVNKPFSLSITTMGIAIMPKHLSADNPPNPIGTGPFRFKEQTPDNHIILERNQDYFSSPFPPLCKGRTGGVESLPPLTPPYSTNPDGFSEREPGTGKGGDEVRGAGLLERIDAFGYDTQSQWLAGFMKGETDVIYFLSGEQYEQVNRDTQFTTYQSPYVWNYAVEYDLNHPLFKDKAVRQALAQGVNIPELIQKMEGVQNPVDDQSPVDVRLQPKVSTGPFIPQTWWHNPAVKPLEYNPALAMQLLNSAGWQLNKQGILEKDGAEFRFTLLVNPVVRQGKLMAMLLYQELFKLGIIVELQEYAFPPLCKGRTGGVESLPPHTPPYSTNPDGFSERAPGTGKGGGDEDGAAYLTVFCTMPDPAELEFDWHSQSSNRLYKLWANSPVIDRLFDQGKRFTDINQRRPIYQQLHQTLYADQPALFLYFHYNSGAVSNRFTNTEELFTPAMPFWTIKDWRIHRRAEVGR